MKQLLKNISPLNNRTEMPAALFVVKKILAFWLCYIAGLFLAEGVVILLHFALGKNMLVGDVFDPQTITLMAVLSFREQPKNFFAGELCYTLSRKRLPSGLQ